MEDDLQSLIDGDIGGVACDGWSNISGLESLFRSDSPTAEGEQVDSSLQVPMHCQVMDVALDDPSLQTAWRELDSNFEMKQVWEQGFWKQVFGDEDVLHSLDCLKRPAVVPIPEASVASSTPAKKKTKTVCSKGHWMQVIVRNIDELSWREELDAKRDTAIKRWFDLFACFPSSFQVAAQLRELGSIDEQLRMIRDVLSGKSPQTLVKRANSLLRLTQFLRSKQVEFPGREALQYEMFCEMRAGGAPSSRLQGVVEAIRFGEQLLHDLMHFSTTS